MLAKSYLSFLITKNVGRPERNCRTCGDYIEDPKGIQGTYCRKMRVLLPDEEAEKKFSRLCTDTDEVLREFYLLSKVCSHR